MAKSVSPPAFAVGVEPVFGGEKMKKFKRLLRRFFRIPVFALWRFLRCPPCCSAMRFAAERKKRLLLIFPMRFRLIRLRCCAFGFLRCGVQEERLWKGILMAGVI